jgi:hypothetical protein
MPENARNQKLNSMNYKSNSQRKNRSSQDRQSKAENRSVQIERRTHSLVGEPLDPIEDAMDVAIGGEGKPWVERRKAA